MVCVLLLPSSLFLHHNTIHTHTHATTNNNTAHKQTTNTHVGWLVGWLVVVHQGARTSIYLASSPDVRVTGKYFDSCKPVPSSPISYDLSVAVRLWDVSQELTEGALARAASLAAAAAAGRAGSTLAAAAATTA